MSAELNFSAMAQGLSLRPARSCDEPCIVRIYRSARPDLLWIDGEADLIEAVQRQQYQVLQIGAGKQYPNAMHFMVEKSGSTVGVVMVDFGHNEVRVIFLAMLPEARGQGYGKVVLQALQQAAQQVRCPLAAVVWHSNGEARKLYQSLGFVQEEAGSMADKLIWYPEASRIMVGAG
ncbi:GNAT family N-acetyltransferase [Chromobacterium alticapitis]|uniref:GNAT family N-acetyltransferase n=1 Tax=Chromobacterium alticapitis TaxID=2073169 RepID=A0A2S5DA82_9NEIS|nr:GNAT family N-acetyltransferase [Chromobacterium alticapitis]POZ59953.1 GNAT family N-acetyltransferase [Chromobacterium alticapitis]